jgi:hypothetical protein
VRADREGRDSFFDKHRRVLSQCFAPREPRITATAN